LLAQSLVVCLCSVSHPIAFTTLPAAILFSISACCCDLGIVFTCHATGAIGVIAGACHATGAFTIEAGERADFASSIVAFGFVACNSFRLACKS
jgi:hypothetical protein